jgi:hypothetical protein
MIYGSASYFETAYWASAYWSVEPPVTPPAAVCGVDLMEIGAVWLSGQLQSFASKPVYYIRNGTELALCVTPGRTSAVLEPIPGESRLEYRDRDYILPSAQLVIEGAAITPQAGDRIRETIAGQSYLFELMAEEGEPAWRYSDPSRRLLRIHTKQVEILSA